MAPTSRPGKRRIAKDSTLRERKNWLIHLLYTRGEFARCLRVIEEQLRLCNGLCEYPIYVKALIKRQNGEIHESLQLFQAATCLNPHNISNLKQVGRSLYLLGKHKAAIDVYEEAQRIGIEDWEIYYNKALCFTYLGMYGRAVSCLEESNRIQRHDCTYMQLGRVQSLMGEHEEAVKTYQEALEFSPENPEILTTIGLLHLRLGKNNRAFDFLGSSMTHDPRNPKTILAAGSIMQDSDDNDVALVKYRIAAVLTPNSSQLWNNIGMCFFGKRKWVAAIACLKRALYLDPFQWIIAYNLGLVHLTTSQYASAFHYLSSSINLRSDYASSFMYLAVTLSRLEDFETACRAYDRALQLESGDHVIHLNYAITLLNNMEMDKAKEQFMQFETLFKALDDETKHSDPDVLEQRQLLADMLGGY